jgi:hypothetical protein
MNADLPMPPRGAPLANHTRAHSFLRSLFTTNAHQRFAPMSMHLAIIQSVCVDSCSRSFSVHLSTRHIDCASSLIRDFNSSPLPRARLSATIRCVSPPLCPALSPLSPACSLGRWSFVVRCWSFVGVAFVVALVSFEPRLGRACTRRSVAARPTDLPHHTRTPTYSINLTRILRGCASACALLALLMARPLNAHSHAQRPTVHRGS